MKVSERGLELIKQHEGLRLRAYDDGAGVQTIGYGTTKGVKPGQTCTIAEALSWLRRDVEEAEAVLNRLVKVPLTQNQADSLISFIYNVGPTNFKHSTMLRRLNERDYESAAKEFPRWVYAGGKVLSGLGIRRKAEQMLFETE